MSKALLTLALLYAADAVADQRVIAPTADPMQPARHGDLQCWYPDGPSKTCRTIFSYTFTGDTPTRIEADILLTPDPHPATVHAILDLRIRRGTLCATLDELAPMNFLVAGAAPSSEEAQALRNNVSNALRRTETCWWPNGIDPPYIWIRRSDGYQVAHSPRGVDDVLAERMNPLLGARLGYDACFQPNFEAHTCFAMSHYSFGQDGAIHEARRITMRSAPLTVMQILSDVAVQARSICFQWSEQDLRAASFEIGGRPATAEEAAAVRESVQRNLFHGSTCLPAPLPVGGDMVTSLLGFADSAWVRPEERFTVGCVRQSALLDECRLSDRLNAH